MLAEEQVTRLEKENEELKGVNERLQTQLNKSDEREASPQRNLTEKYKKVMANISKIPDEKIRTYLAHNNQSVQGSRSVLKERLVDRVLKGRILPCPNCQKCGYTGGFVEFDSKTYHCGPVIDSSS